MKANEFIKKQGWERAKDHLHKMNAENWHNSFFKDLKRYVDAYELVQSYGGVDKLHDFALSVWRCNKDDPFVAKAKQAIALVEECQ